MTDTDARSFRNAAALKRLKGRRAADARFKFYGRLAIVVALAALAMLLVSVGTQAFSAATHHVVRYDIELDPARIAPDGASAPEDISRNVEGFYGLARDSLLETFPEANTIPAQRLLLAKTLTRLAVLPAAREVAARPELIGNAYTLTAPLNHDLDLFLKGRGAGEMRVEIGSIAAAKADADGEVTLTGPDAFKAVVTRLASLRAEMGPAADTLSVLVTSGRSTGRLSDITANTARLDLLTGDAADFEQSRPAGRIFRLAESERNVSDQQIAWVLALKDLGRVSRVANTGLLTQTDSTYPELAGGLAAIVGSLLTMLITAFVAVPIGVLAAVYLEEFAPKNRVTDLIEVNINNLAAVPSIVFGLLGAALFLNFLDMPRSAPLVGGLVLALLTFPVVIIASRAALKAVPPSIRAGALAVGASKMQIVFHHVVPLAAPGILTGAILGMARALGETAPLLLIGMVAFVGDVPRSPLDESTVLPVQIFSWSNNAERAWEPMTAALIVILLVLLLLMNSLVVFLRSKFERRW